MQKGLISQCLKATLSSTLLATLSLWETAVAEETWHCDKSPILIQNVHVWTGGDILSPKDILIQNGKIEWVGETGNIHSNKVAKVINGSGLTALPGLIDSHTHFDTLPAAAPIQSDLDNARDVFPITMRQTLASGVTYARTHLAALTDMALMSKLAADICFPSPRLSLSGPGILAGAPNVNRALMRGISGADDARSKINELADHGAEWIALHNIQNFTEEERVAILKTVEQRSLKLLADTDGLEALNTALQFPVTSGEYLNRSDVEIYPTETLDMISDLDGRYYNVPPIGYYYRAKTYANRQSPAAAPASFLFINATIADRINETYRDGFRSNRYVKRILDAYTTLAPKFMAVRNAGAIQVIGSDSGSPGQFHHDAVWWEMETWRQIGVSPGDVIKAATILPAQMLDKTMTGRIEAGALADLVLYQGNPENGPFDRNRVQSVLKGGVIYVSDSKWVGPNSEQTTKMIEFLKAELQ